MKLSEHFTDTEFRCKHCNNLPDGMPPKELIDALEIVRNYFNAPVIINSGYRCPEHNLAVGGAPASRHVVGDAADFTVKGVKTEIVHKFCLEKFDDKPYGIAVKIREANPYAGFTHLDVRGKKARWTY